MDDDLAIFWFRQDLRLHDNQAFFEACAHRFVLLIYIFDDSAPKAQRLGAASKYWLKHSLDKLSASLGKKLNFYEGSAASVIRRILKSYKVSHVYYNICFEPWQIERDALVEKMLNSQGINVQKFNSNFLWHPSSILKDDFTFYKVFTPFKKKALSTLPRKKLDQPLCKAKYIIDDSQKGLEHCLIQYASVLQAFTQEGIGEEKAYEKFNSFIEKGAKIYKDSRDFPSSQACSGLSAHLHFGEISVAFIYERIIQAQLQGSLDSINSDHFISQLIWREFSNYLLYHIPGIYKENINKNFDEFPWKDDIKRLKAWQNGQTGYPIVDAGMRELKETGYMHNRVRMIAASFLVKNLNIHWHHGRDWFWDHLFDADLANNSVSWQWVAGSGVDAAPFFRIFNPVLQGKKFDAQGKYTLRFVPELSKLNKRFIFNPWEAPLSTVEEAGLVLGQDYPRPIVNQRNSRDYALCAYKSLKRNVKISKK
jgi:deoxyribodipyrimidine photo-lyase